MTKTRKRVWTNLLTVGGLLTALGFAGTALTTAAGADLYQAATPWNRIAREQARAERLEAQLQETLRRISARDEIVEALRAGRLTLWEAAARFRDLDAHCPDPRPAILILTTRQSDPTGHGLSYEECVCRNILEYVRRANEIQDPNSPNAGAGKVFARLEEEFRQLTQAGGLHLPE